VLGKWGWRTLRYHGEVHTLIVAPTGSGKTTTTGIPTTLTWPHSLFVHDPKGELREHSARWRSRFSRIVYIDPTSPDSDCYDPLRAIRLDSTHVIRDTDMVVDILVDPDGEAPKSGAERHFRQLTAGFLRGLLLHGLYTGCARTLPEFDRFFFSESSLHQIVKEMETTAHTPQGPHWAVVRGVRMLRRLADRELSGLLSTTARTLEMTTDPLVARILSRNTFSLLDLRERERPISLYLTVPYNEQTRLLPFSRLMVRQWLYWTTRRLHGWRHRMCMLIDECQALKYFPAIPDALNFVRGYGLNLVLITPSLNELDRIYGPKNNFVEGCHLRLVFAPNDPRIAEHFSHMTGTEDVPDLRRPGVTTEERLLSATGVTFLPKDKGLLLIGNGGYPALIRKAPHYRSLRMLWRSRKRFFVKRKGVRRAA
jgi:type IV secretion system protein VirD4